MSPEHSTPPNDPELTDIYDDSLPEEGSEMPVLLARAQGDEQHLALLVAARRAQIAMEAAGEADREALREAHTKAVHALADYEYSKTTPKSP